MTTQQGELQRERLEETSGQEVWLGEPIALHHTGDRFRFGWLGQNPRFPGRHVHPAVRADAEAVLKVTGERDALVKQHADHLQARLAFVQKLRKNPDRAEAVRQLQAYDGNVELLASDIPDADADVLTAWRNLDATIAAVWPEWLAYLRQKGQEAARQLHETIYGAPAWSLRRVLDELELLDGLSRLEGIIPDRTPTVNTEIRASFDRHLRLASLTRLWDTWTLPGDQGEQYGIGALPAIYRSVFATPEPVVEVAADDEMPIAVQHRLENLGLDPDTVDRSRITGIPDEVPYVGGT